MSSWVDPTTGDRHHWGVVADEASAVPARESLLMDDSFESGLPLVEDPGDQDDNYRRQMHVSRWPGNALTLGPDQVAILPLSFFPRFPSKKKKQSAPAQCELLEESSTNLPNPDDTHDRSESRCH